MGKIWIAGLGPGDADAITLETMRAIEQADKVILRTEMHPAVAGLKARGIEYTACDRFYESGDSFSQVYEDVANYVLAEATGSESVCFCLPGHPLVAEESVSLLLKKLEHSSIDAEVLPAVSFLDSVFVAMDADPLREKLSIFDAASLWEDGVSGIAHLPGGACLFAQVYSRLIAGELKLALLETAPAETEVYILHHAGIRGEERRVRCLLSELDHFQHFDHLTSVYLPCKNNNEGGNRLSRYPLDDLAEVFRRLLSPDGCPWDRKQTHESLKPYLLEEANEALEAIDEKDMPHLKEELGDVLMQIVFHCALADERGDFDLNDVIAGITEKMIRRHPHVFGDEKAENPDEVMVLWQKIKDREKREAKMEGNEKKRKKTQKNQ